MVQGKNRRSKNISLSNNTGSQIVGEFDGSSFTGTVVLSNTNSHSFNAEPNTGNESGVFRVYGDLAMQENLEAGWIINSGNEERGSLQIRSVFKTTPKKPKTNFGTISDGSSNTILIGERSFQIQRFFISRFSGNPDFDLSTSK